MVGHATDLKRCGNRNTIGTQLNPRNHKVARDINSNPTVNEPKIKIWAVSKQLFSPFCHFLPKESQLPKPSSCSIIMQGRDACILHQERLVSGSNYPRAWPVQSIPRQSHDRGVLSPTPRPTCPPLQVPIIPSEHYDTISEISLILCILLVPVEPYGRKNCPCRVHHCVPTTCWTLFVHCHWKEIRIRVSYGHTSALQRRK